MFCNYSVQYEGQQYRLRDAVPKQLMGILTPSQCSPQINPFQRGATCQLAAEHSPRGEEH